MDVHTRLANAEQQSHELHKTFSHLDHRIREFIELQTALIDMHSHLQMLAAHLEEVRSELAIVHQVLPTIARKEELARFEKRLDAIPFERFATRKDHD